MKDSLRSIAASTLRLIPSRSSFGQFAERVGDVDLIIVVLNVPASFAKVRIPALNHYANGGRRCQSSAGARCTCRTRIGPRRTGSATISMAHASRVFVQLRSLRERPRLLAERIREKARTFDPAGVRATFERVQPQLLHSDRPALMDFLKRVEDGTIHSELHRSHFSIGR